MTKKQHDIDVILVPIDRRLHEFHDEGHGLRCVGCGKLTMYRDVGGGSIYVRFARHLSDCLFIKNENPYIDEE
jgi:hypothetical protein